MNFLNERENSTVQHFSWIEIDRVQQHHGVQPNLPALCAE